MSSNKLINKRKILSSIVFLIIAFIYSIAMMIVCRSIGFDSDKANHLLQARDVLDGNVFLKDWNLTGVTFLSTDLVFYEIGCLFGGVSFRGVYFSLGLMVAITLIAGYFCSFVGYKNTNGKKVLYVLLVAIPSVDLLFHFRVHTGAVLYILVSFILFYCLINKLISKYFIWLLGLLMVLGTFGDLLVAIECCAPICVYSLYYFAIKENHERTEYLKYIILSLFSAVLGLVVQKLYIFIGGANFNAYITSKRNFTNANEWINKTQALVKDVLDISGANFTGHYINDIWFTLRVVNFGVLLIVLVIIIGIIIKIFKKKDVDALSYLLILGIVFSSCAYVFTDMALPRYITVIPIFSYIIFIRNIHSIFQYFSNKKLISSLVIFIVLISGSVKCRDIFKMVFTDHSIHNFTVVSNDSNIELINFLYEHNLNYGYGSFWNSSILTVLSKEKVAVRHIDYKDDCFQYMNWFCKNSWYEEEANFILINTNGAGDGLFNNNADSAIRFFGDPTVRYDFNGYIILVYDYDLSKALGHKRNPLIDNKVTVSEMYFGNSEAADNFVVLHNSGIAYGPYATIDPGNYVITFYGDNMSDADCDIYSESSDSNSYSYKEISHNNNEIVINLNVNTTINDIEFRLFNKSTSDVVLYYINVD